MAQAVNSVMLRYLSPEDGASQAACSLGPKVERERILDSAGGSVSSAAGVILELLNHRRLGTTYQDSNQAHRRSLVLPPHAHGL